ncbi:MAG: ABC transporter permease [Desulfobacterales bacterium]
MATDDNGDSVEVIHIKAPTGLQFPDFAELNRRKDLIVSFVWRNLKSEYAQTVLGLFWAILQPLIQIIIFTVVFGRIAKISTGNVPYLLFASFGIIPWTYMSSAMTLSIGSLVSGQHLLTKIYFPRLIFPLTPVISRLVAFAISLFILLFVAVYYRITPTWHIVLLPLFIVYMIIIALGPGLWLSPLSVRYRDVQQAMPFVIRMLMFAAPVVYPVTAVPERFRFLYSLNPIVGAIDGFRACALGLNVDWMLIWPGLFTAGIVLISGAMYFTKMEKIFADVV